MPPFVDAMNDSERSVFEYLRSQNLGAVVYEPDGNIPPDFLVDGRIAVEARRLNENEDTPAGHRGLEVTSRPLAALVRKALLETGPPAHGTSWFVSYTYRRPLPPWKHLNALLRDALRQARHHEDLSDEEFHVGGKMRLHFIRASNAHPTMFVLGASSDHDSGGFVVAEMAENLRICMAEKSEKVRKVQCKYAEWWLALEDRIGYGVLNADDHDDLRQLVQRTEPWSKVILVNPLEPSTGFEL